MRLYAHTAYSILSRKKPLTETATPDDAATSSGGLARVLTTLDLTALGVGSTMGVGVYVLAGAVSRNSSGPAIVLSFLIAAIASVFAALCYAEFGARVPKAGSAYIYSYVCVGEFVAYIIGWNLIMEYAIGAASVVKAISTYLDALIGKVISTYLREHVPIHVSFLAPYPDFFAFGVTMLFTVALAFGAKESSRFNNLFTLLNLAVVVYFVGAGSIKADPANWAIKKEEVPEGYGDGGFAPYGMVGIIAGASKCFYGFIGFDCVATAGEEAKNPKKSLPIAVIGSLFITFLSYFSISTVLTMLLPYYEQDVNAPLTHAFELLGWTTSQYIVSIGAIFGLCASLMGSMFPLPRIIYAMASDGLLFKFMGKVHPKFKTPFAGTLLAGFLTGLMAMFFDLEELVDMMSIGTLLAYSMVAACVMLLRYEIDRDVEEETKNVPIGTSGVIQTFFNIGRTTKLPTKTTSAIVTWAATSYTVLCLLGCIIATQFPGFSNGEAVPLVIIHLIAVLALTCLVVVYRQPPSLTKLTFTVPFVPWLPALSILVNVFLMMSLSFMTWIRFMLWVVLGLMIYFFYGLWHSHERECNRKRLSANRAPVISSEEPRNSLECGHVNEGFQAQV